MIYLGLKRTGERYDVIRQVFSRPVIQKILDEGTDEEYVFVEELPVANDVQGKVAVLKATYPDKELYYEYVEIQKNDNEIEQLRNENLELKLAMVEMAEAQAMSDLETKLALVELAEAFAGGGANG